MFCIMMSVQITLFLTLRHCCYCCHTNHVFTQLAKYQKGGVDRSYVLKAADEIKLELEDHMLNLQVLLAQKLTQLYVFAHLHSKLQCSKTSSSCSTFMQQQQQQQQQHHAHAVRQTRVAPKYTRSLALLTRIAACLPSCFAITA
jgi:hypothetical protein